MRLYPHPSDGTPVPGAVVFPYRGYDISLSNLFGRGEIAVFQGGVTPGETVNVTPAFSAFTHLPTARGLREVMAAIDKHLDA